MALLRLFLRWIDPDAPLRIGEQIALSQPSHDAQGKPYPPHTLVTGHEGRKYRIPRKPDEICGCMSHRLGPQEFNQRGKP